MEGGRVGEGRREVREWEEGRWREGEEGRERRGGE